MEDTVAAYKRPESVLVLVYTLEGKVLMMERAHPNGFWQSVTGSLKWHEPVQQAARRELREETGLLPGRLRDLRYFTSFRIRPPWRDLYETRHQWNREHWFALALPRHCTIRINRDEHRQYRWMPWQQALHQASSHTNRNCIRYIFGYSQA